MSGTFCDTTAHDYKPMIETKMPLYRVVDKVYVIHIPQARCNPSVYVYS